MKAGIGRHKSAAERGFALITALAILAIFLAVCFVILTMTNQNSTNFGNGYQKQRYYDVAEAGIDRGLADLDSNPASPGSTATPAPPPSPPSGNQTSLPNVPGVPYFYSYWYNNQASATSTPDPLATQFAPSSQVVNVPGYGALIWSYTVVGSRDVAVEAVVTRFGTSTGSCAICAAQNIAATGSDNFSAPATVCGNQSKPFKICSDPNASPSPAPTSVPIIAGGSYQCSGAEPSPCTLTPTAIQTNAPAGIVAGFLASQGTIDELSNAAAWQAASTANTNIHYIVCASGCDTAALQPVAPSAGQITFVNGNISLSSKTVLTYGGTFIVSGCLNVSQPGMQGTTTSAYVIVLGTDANCGGSAASFAGGGNSKPALFDGGTLYAAQGSVSIAGNGSVRGYNFYGAIVAAGSVSVSGNGFFAWQSALIKQSLILGPFAIDSFAQY